jgi:hypothetical protein
MIAFIMKYENIYAQSINCVVLKLNKNNKFYTYIYAYMHTHTLSLSIRLTNPIHDQIVHCRMQYSDQICIFKEKEISRY